MKKVLSGPRSTDRTADGRLGDGGMAEQLDVRLGPVFAQQPQRRQRDEKIAQRAAADDQDFHAVATCRKNRNEASLPAGHCFQTAQTFFAAGTSAIAVNLETFIA
jgi:hypothetical protein